MVLKVQNCKSNRQVLLEYCYKFPRLHTNLLRCGRSPPVCLVYCFFGHSLGRHFLANALLRTVIETEMHFDKAMHPKATGLCPCLPATLEDEQRCQYGAPPPQKDPLPSQVLTTPASHGLLHDGQSQGSSLSPAPHHPSRPRSRSDHQASCSWAPGSRTRSQPGCL